MQIIHKDEDEESDSREADPVDVIICTGRISRCLEGKYARGLRSKSVGI